ncbi:MAG: prephenate dehydratase, partial [Pontibacterium sp.]
LSRTENLPEFNPETRYITTLMFAVRNIPAALYKALGGFSTNGVNMVKLESYMASDTMTVSSFHLDLEAHPNERAMQYALQELNFFAKNVRIVGTYAAHPFRYQSEMTVE